MDIFGSWLRSASTYSDQATGQRHELHIDVIAEKGRLGKKMSLLLRHADADVQPQHPCARVAPGGGRPIRTQPPITLALCWVMGMVPTRRHIATPRLWHLPSALTRGEAVVAHEGAE